MPSEETNVPAPDRPVPPRGINHIVLTVRDMERSHRFWTELMGFHQVAELQSTPDRPRPKMRFYSGLDAKGDVNHHDVALMEVPAGEVPAETKPEWSLRPREIGLNHVAITWPDRDAWLQQIAFLRARGVKFHLRINHGMTHSAYISDPDGHGIEVLYELPEDVWKGDIQGAQMYAERLPTEGDEALIDTTENPVFKR